MDGRPEKRAKKTHAAGESIKKHLWQHRSSNDREEREALSRGGGGSECNGGASEREREKGRKSIFCAESVKEKRGREGKDCCSVTFCCGKKGMEFRSYREERRGIVMKGGGEDRKATRGEERRRESALSSSLFITAVPAEEKFAPSLVSFFSFFSAWSFPRQV